MTHNKTLCDLAELRFTIHEGTVNLVKACSVLKTIPITGFIDQLTKVDRQQLTKAIEQIGSATNILYGLYSVCSDKINKELKTFECSNVECVKREPATITEVWAVCDICGTLFRATDIGVVQKGELVYKCPKCCGYGHPQELRIDNTND